MASVLSLVVVKSKNGPRGGAEYNVYSTFQSHEPEFDYLKSLEIEEKINKIRWLPQSNAAHFLLSTNGSFSTWCQPGRVGLLTTLTSLPISRQVH